MWREFFALVWKLTSTKILIFSSQRHKICLLVVWNVRDYNVYDALYAYALHTFAFAYVFVIMLKNIESHFQSLVCRFPVYQTICIRMRIVHFRWEIVYRTTRAEEWITRLRCSKMGKFWFISDERYNAMRWDVHCFCFSSATAHRCTKHSSFSVSRRNSNAFAWLKSIFAFSCMLRPHSPQKSLFLTE